MELKGRIIKIKEVNRVNDRFSKREFILKFVEDGQSTDYPQECNFECHKVEILDNVAEGQAVEISFNLRGRHWKEDKWFNTLVCWKINPLAKEETAPAITIETLEQGDDLPF